MPRTYPPRRTLLAVRLSPAGVEQIDALAERDGITRSELIRRALAEYVKRHSH